MCTCRVLCCCTRKGVCVCVCWRWVSIPASMRLARTQFEKVTLDWIATESEEEKRNRGFCSRQWAGSIHGPCEFISQSKKRPRLPPHKNTPPTTTSSPICKMGRLFSSVWWFAMCPLSRNSVTPFSNNVNIIQLLFFSLFLLKGAGTHTPPPEKHQDRCEDLGAGVTFPVEVVCYLF